MSEAAIFWISTPDPTGMVAAIDPACGSGVFLQTRTLFFFPCTVFVTSVQ